MVARRQRDENPVSSVAAETMKLLANSSYGYQIMNHSRHTVTKYLTDEKTHSAINSKKFKRPYHITDQLYEVELVESENEQREPIVIFLLRMQPTLSSPELAVMPTRNIIRESRDYLKKSLDVQKCCAV